MNYTESKEQKAFMQWLRLNHPKIFDVTFHTPNARKTSPRSGMFLNQEGRKAGVPDLFIAYPENGFHGLFIEMKSSKRVGKEESLLTHDQKIMINNLRARGYCVQVCKGLEKAIDCINEYLSDN